MREHRRRQQRGLTLVEALVTVTILGVVLSMAVPAYQNLQQHTRLRGATDVLASELRLAQSESQKRQQSVSLNFRVTTDGWCYGYSVASSCDCRVANACTIDGVDSARWHTQFPGVGIEPGVSGNRFAFQPLRGTVTAGNVTLTSANGTQLRVVVSGLGRIRVCTPAGPGRYAGFPVC